MSFKRLLIIAILIAPFVYAYREKPLLDDHKVRIYQLAGNSEEPLKDAQLELPAWDGLEYVDWMVITGTRDKEKQSLVSFGIVKYIKVVDTDWGPNSLGLLKDSEKKAQ
jgi:hypothetical protein